MRNFAGCLAIALCAALAGVPPAQAADVIRTSGPFLYVVRTSAEVAAGLDGSTTAPCPDRSTVVGGGGAVGPVTDEDDDSRITASINSTTPPTGFEIGGPSDEFSHTFTAVAVCLRTTAQSSLRNSSTPITVDGGDSHRFSMGCFSFENAVGGGSDMGTPTGGFRLTASFPLGSNWVIHGHNSTTTARSTSNSVICLNKDTMKVRNVSHSTLVPRFGAKNVRVGCPSSFRVGSGGFSTGEFSRVISSLPFDGSDRDRAPDDGWKIRVLNGDGQDVAATAYAVCIRNP